MGDPAAVRSIRDIFRGWTSGRSENLPPPGNTSSEGANRAAAAYVSHRVEQLLSKVPLLGGAPEAFRVRLRDRVKPLFFAPGDWIFERPEHVLGLYLVLSGTAELRSAEKMPSIITVTSDGFFGEDALLLGHSSIGSGRATTACDLALLGRDEFSSLLELYPSVGSRLQLVPKKKGKSARAGDQKAPAGVGEVSVHASSESVRISWPHVAGAVAYQILRKTPSGNWEALSHVAEPPYWDTNPVKGARYRVRGLNQAGFGETSEAGGGS